jgi:hypothetical protein
MNDANAGVEALLLRSFERGQRSAGAAALIAEGGQFRILGGQLFCQRVIGGDRHEGCAENRVRTGRVDLQLGLAAGRRIFRQLPADRRPSDRPIQFFCITRTFSGHWSSASSESSADPGEIR